MKTSSSLSEVAAVSVYVNCGKLSSPGGVLPSKNTGDVPLDGVAFSQLD